jgi:hypothetical protein
MYEETRCPKSKTRYTYSCEEARAEAIQAEQSRRWEPLASDDMIAGSRATSASRYGTLRSFSSLSAVYQAARIVADGHRSIAILKTRGCAPVYTSGIAL